MQRAKFELTVDEAEDWVAYANKRGTLNLGLRMEAGFALVAWMLARGFKLTKEDHKPYTMQDFMWHLRDKQDGDEELSFEEAIQAFHRIGTTR